MSDPAPPPVAPSIIDNSEIYSLVRHLLSAAGGMVIAHGWVNASDWESISGMVMLLVPIAWAIYQKRQMKIAVVKAAATGIATQPTVGSSVSMASVSK